MKEWSVHSQPRTHVVYHATSFHISCNVATRWPYIYSSSEDLVFSLYVWREILRPNLQTITLPILLVSSPGHSLCLLPLVPEPCPKRFRLHGCIAVGLSSKIVSTRCYEICFGDLHGIFIGLVLIPLKMAGVLLSITLLLTLIRA